MMHLQLSFARKISFVLILLLFSLFVGIISASAATLTVNSNTGDYAVDGACNFAEAVASINTGSDTGDCVADITEPYGTNDTIEFNVGGGGAQTISFTNNVWDGSFTRPVYINGLSQPAGLGDPATCGTVDLTDRNLLISFDLNQTGLFRFEFAEGSAGSTIEGIHLYDAEQAGMYIMDDSITISCSHIGTNLAGTSASVEPNQQAGFRVGDQTLIHGVKSGITFGGPNITDGNIISGNVCEALHLSGNGLDSLTIQNNIIGGDITGTADIGNGGGGIKVVLDDPASTYSNIDVVSNIIHYNGLATVTQPACGLTAGDENSAVYFDRAQSVTVNGNTITNSFSTALDFAYSEDVVITGNTITDSNEGVYMTDVDSVTIGGPLLSERNIIMRQDGQAIDLQRVTSASISNNILSDSDAGMQISAGAQILVGGEEEDDANIITGNTTAGIVLTPGGVAPNLIAIIGNYIGIESDGVTPNSNEGAAILGIAGDEVLISENIIYQASTEIGAAIALFSIQAPLALQNFAIVGNSIYGDSDVMAFDLSADTVGDFEPDTLIGPNPNDAGDIDTGPNVGFDPGNNLNKLLNYPEFASVDNVDNALTTDIEFILDVPAGDYRIEFFQNSGATDYGQGETFLDSLDITHTGSGEETFNITLPVTVGDYIAATATERGLATFSTFGATSEFSAATEIQAFVEEVRTRRRSSSTSQSRAQAKAVFDAYYNKQATSEEQSSNNSGKEDNTTCPINQILTQNLTQGARDGQYHNYTGTTVTEVALLQQYINEILSDAYESPAGPVDGIFGPLTKQGVERMQQALLERYGQDLGTYGIDGIVGPFTRAAINGWCEGKIPENA